MNGKKTAAITVTAAGASYMAYRAVSNEVLNKIFALEHTDMPIDAGFYEWINSSKVTSVKVKSFDGLQLNAYKVENNETDRYVILVHGSTTNKAYMYPQALAFDKLGYNILLVDQRGAGESQGDYQTYGFKEAQDLQIWINYLVSKNPAAKICLYGVSAGAATVMLATGYKLPENVKCLVEDSGFSSLEEMLAHKIKKDYKILVTYPVTLLIENKMKERFGIRFSDVSPKLCLENNEIPILFIHSEEDELVPFEMAKILYNHNKGVKKYYPIKDSRHGLAYQDPSYFENVDRFISTYM